MSVREQCRKIYSAAFGETPVFDDLLFETYFDCCRYVMAGKQTAAMLFLLPCLAVIDGVERPARYLYAAATAPECRGQGHMTRLLRQVCAEDELIFLKPASDSLTDFYARRGFRRVRAVPDGGKDRIVTDARFAALADLCKPETQDYTLMYHSLRPCVIDQLCFADTLE